ncbi:MAG: hypothetical protein MNPFHGCM_01932 [Gemmatimonadaceae bacterium]|nr:hypothetical protein [Gemmatimonadaceae bacterium]
MPVPLCPKMPSATAGASPDDPEAIVCVALEGRTARLAMKAPEWFPG